jgi:O-antigen ligase
MDRERAIELTLVGLVAAILFSAPLRDALAALLIVLLAFDRSAREDRRNPVADLAVAAFLAITVVTSLLSRWPEETLRLLSFYPYGVLVFLGARRVVSSRGAASLALVTLGAIVVLAVDGLAQARLGTSPLTGRIPVWGRYPGSFPFPADVSLLPILFPIASSVLVASPGPRAVRLVLLALVSAAVALSGTRAGSIALLSVVAVEAIGRHRRDAVTSVAVVVLGFVIAGTLAPKPSTRALGLEGLPAEEIKLVAGREHRIEQWRAAVRLWTEAPILGHGPHSFRRLCVERVTARDPAFADVDLDWAPYPHDVYLETLVGSGLLGLAGLLGVLALPFRRARSADPTLGAARRATVAFALVALFDLSLTKDWVQLALWLPIGVAVGSQDRAGFEPDRQRRRRRRGISNPATPTEARNAKVVAGAGFSEVPYA